MIFSHRQKGFSILELMVGLGIGAIVSLTGAYVAVQSTNVNQATSLQTELNQEHIVATQRLRDTDNILARLGINNANVLGCFSKRSAGFNCSTLNMLNHQVVNFDFATCVGATCNFVHELQYRLDCGTSLMCSRLELRLTTSLRPDIEAQRQYFATARISNISVSGLTLNSRAQIDFSCSAGNRLITGISFVTLNSSCDGYLGAQTCTTATNPLRQFGSAATCQSMIAGNCATNGFTGLGMFEGQSTCNVGTTPPPPPPVEPDPPTPDRCESTLKEWTVGVNRCSGWVGAENVGSDGNATDREGPTTGEAFYDCTPSGWVDFRRSSWTCVDTTPPPPPEETCGFGAPPSYEWLDGDQGYDIGQGQCGPDTYDRNAPPPAKPCTSANVGEKIDSGTTCGGGVLDRHFWQCTKVCAPPVPPAALVWECGNDNHSERSQCGHSGATQECVGQAVQCDRSGTSCPVLGATTSSPCVYLCGDYGDASCCRPFEWSYYNRALTPPSTCTCVEARNFCN